jgi:hypothetical protein
VNSSSLRPKGTVEVRCSIPGCGIAWWIDPLDPRLSDRSHVWDCGADHDAERVFDRLNAELHLRYGIVYRGSADGTKCGCGSSAKRHYYRDARVLSRRNGLLLNVDRLGSRSVVEVLSLIEWNPEVWPESALADGWHESGVPPKASPGMVHWVGYREERGGAEAPVRRYTFAKCARCGYDLHVDVEDPTRRSPKGHSLPYGGGEMPAPAWLGRTLFCEDVLGTDVYSPQPCAVAMGMALAAYEELTGNRWTWWESGYGARPTYVIFRAKDGDALGLFHFEVTELDPVAPRVWGTPRELLATLPDGDGAPWELKAALAMLAGGGCP